MERRSAASGPCVLARQKGVGDESVRAPRPTSSPETGGYGLFGVLGPRFLFGARLGQPVAVRDGRGRVLSCGSARRCPRVQLSADPAYRSMVNVGSVPAAPAEPLGLGQAHRPLLPPGRGGGPVVVVAVTRHQGGRKAVQRAKGSSEPAARLDGRRSPVNTGALLPDTGSGYFTDNSSCTSGRPLQCS
jgi:hypothetical protein